MEIQSVLILPRQHRGVAVKPIVGESRLAFFPIALSAVRSASSLRLS